MREEEEEEEAKPTQFTRPRDLNKPEIRTCYSGPETFSGLEAPRFSSKLYRYIARANGGPTRDLKDRTL
jgi:hypothetical protein